MPPTPRLRPETFASDAERAAWWEVTAMLCVQSIEGLLGDQPWGSIPNDIFGDAIQLVIDSYRWQQPNRGAPDDEPIDW